MTEQDNETRTCSDCGAEFAFSAEERRFFEERGLTPPKRCRACRRARKAERAFAPAGGRGPGGGGDRGGRDRPSFDRGGDRPSGDRGGDRPSGDRGGDRPMSWGGRRDEGFRGPPGYGRGGGEGDARGRPRRSRPDDRPGDRASGGGESRAKGAEASAPRPRKERPKYDIVCQQCGAAAQVPFKPIEGRQLFCKPCYDARRASGDGAKPSGETAAATESTAVPEE